MLVVLLLENRRRSLLRSSSSSSRLTTSSNLVEQPPSLHNDSNCEEGEQSLPPPDGLNSSWVALPMNNSNGRDNSKGKNGGLERVPSSMGTWRRFFWTHSMNPDRAAQEAALTMTAFPHKRMGRSCLMWKCTPARTIALSQKKKLQERKKWMLFRKAWTGCPTGPVDLKTFHPRGSTSGTLNVPFP
ncbi:hypothetical protein MJG53_016625 [Ovis ammon polii x Ovis aries]|uniref:Uncharacterized protein n=1 Tax=Ovis ammon polii x Ovis aries TaxID=2918886 RepID=A0ACB9U9R4_9CETA|nr:hypothetical protein MJG53_016625 [Ovis ammon polii x Ovis aries]